MSTASVPRILIVGGGYAGFYTAWKLEKLLRRGEAEVTIVDPLSYMSYQPFLPEVAAGSIEARHAVVAHRRHLHHTNIITAKVSGIDHANKTATNELGLNYKFSDSLIGRASYQTEYVSDRAERTDNKVGLSVGFQF